MALTVKSFGISPYLALNFDKRLPVRCSSNTKVNGAAVNGKYSAVKEESERPDFVNKEKLEPLWDDGYGSETVKDYAEEMMMMTKPDGGPPRWFTPLSCGAHLKDSPILLFLPGIDGLGLGLILHHKSLGKVFDVRCMHVPVQDRTPFEAMVEWVEETVMAEHSSSPKRPIYLVGNSFGGCLALAVAARNPKVDLVLILANPATSFGRSPLQPVFPLLEALPNDLHLLSFVLCDLVKMATVDINTVLSPTQYFEKLSGNLTSLIPRLSGLADIVPKETLLWKLKLLKTAAAYANSRLHAITAEVLVLSSGKDNMLPSRDEALRLLSSIRNCKIRHFKDNGHSILSEDGVNLLTIIKGTSTYRRSRKRDYVMDFLPPSTYEFKQFVERNRWFRNYTGPVMLSTKEDGKIVRGLSGVPNQGPVLLVGCHMLMALELAPLVEEFLHEKKIMVRGIAHPMFFSSVSEGQNKELSITETFKVFGALPVSPSNIFKLLATKSHVLLYPGGVREALHRKGEEYKLFWPDQPEFVRMAARFGATIVPFGVIGEDDIAELVLDYNDLMRIPFLSDQIKRENDQSNIRAGMSGEVANQALHIPGVVPKIPGRLYYLFGKPIETKGRKEMLKDKGKAREFYTQIKFEVESNMSYLLKKRKEDPYRGLVNRTIYRAFRAPIDQVPSFKP
ncbi:hypothetical protein RD792_009127 [Penstemon davidsonii]|uniref:Serine aminopeptidase S33 domain-containing protein n=1 Tax=Penstemon davidsonii TaxID=160366 RepID=A0ABR0DBN4_9LAMI|nr:hypothetical protein RD792_009127 [Penstemon davidsonii]